MITSISQTKPKTDANPPTVPRANPSTCAHLFPPPHDNEDNKCFSKRKKSRTSNWTLHPFVLQPLPRGYDIFQHPTHKVSLMRQDVQTPHTHFHTGFKDSSDTAFTRWSCHSLIHRYADRTVNRSFAPLPHTNLSSTLTSTIGNCRTW